jgi:hypothetical protein
MRAFYVIQVFTFTFYFMFLEIYPKLQKKKLDLLDIHHPSIQFEKFHVHGGVHHLLEEDTGISESAVQRTMAAIQQAK